MGIKFTPILPNLSRLPILTQVGGRVVERVGRKILKPAFDSTVKDWSEDHRPVWEIRIVHTPTKDEFLLLVPIREGDVYHFISGGTDVRYATMTTDFLPKTQPGRISSTRGRGGFLYLNRSRPKPGIKAREYDTQIAEDAQPRMTSIGRAELQKAIRSTGHTI